MKAILAQVPASFLEARKRRGDDRWDEVWKGVLHMPPMPNRWHQELEFQLHEWLRRNWARPRGGKVHQQVNVASPGGWPSGDYRIPDLILLTPDRFHIDRIEYCDGAPAVVIEIRSPGDESYDKLDFYAELGVPEVWIIDRDTRVPEVYVLGAGTYQSQPANADGWIISLQTGIELAPTSDGRLAVRIVETPKSTAELPEES